MLSLNYPNILNVAFSYLSVSEMNINIPLQNEYFTRLLKPIIDSASLNITEITVSWFIDFNDNYWNSNIFTNLSDALVTFGLVLTLTGIIYTLHTIFVLFSTNKELDFEGGTDQTLAHEFD